MQQWVQRSWGTASTEEAAVSIEVKGGEWQAIRSGARWQGSQVRTWLLFWGGSYGKILSREKLDLTDTLTGLLWMILC